MGIKTEAIKNVTTNGLVWAGVLAYNLADKVADRLDIPELSWQGEVGRWGEQGADAFIRYGVPALLVTYGIKYLADSLQDRWE